MFQFLLKLQGCFFFMLLQSEDQTLTQEEDGEGSEEGGRDHIPQKLVCISIVSLFKNGSGFH